MIEDSFVCRVQTAATAGVKSREENCGGADQGGGQEWGQQEERGPQHEAEAGQWPGDGEVDEVDQHQRRGGAEDGRDLGQEHEEGAQRGARPPGLRAPGAGPVQHEAQVLQQVDDEEEEDQKMDHCGFPENQISFILSFSCPFGGIPCLSN